MLYCTQGVSLSTGNHYPTCINIILWESYLLAPEANGRWVVVCVAVRFRLGCHGQFELFPRPALASEGCHFNMSASCRELTPFFIFCQFRYKPVPSLWLSRTDIISWYGDQCICSSNRYPESVWNVTGNCEINLETSDIQGCSQKFQDSTCKKKKFAYLRC